MIRRKQEYIRIQDRIACGRGECEVDRSEKEARILALSAYYHQPEIQAKLNESNRTYKSCMRTVILASDGRKWPRCREAADALGFSTSMVARLLASGGQRDGITLRWADVPVEDGGEVAAD
jgi:hypothetical protein